MCDTINSLLERKTWGAVTSRVCVVRLCNKSINGLLERKTCGAVSSRVCVIRLMDY